MQDPILKLLSVQQVTVLLSAVWIDEARFYLVGNQIELQYKICVMMLVLASTNFHMA